jgi:hypothetical protein
VKESGEDYCNLPASSSAKSFLTGLSTQKSCPDEGRRRVDNVSCWFHATYFRHITSVQYPGILSSVGNVFPCGKIISHPSL